MQIQPEQILQIVSNVLAFVLALELLPGLRDWWSEDVARRWKPAIILALCLVIPLGIMGLECVGYDARVDVSCENPASIPMWLGVISVGLSAFVISQIGYITLARPLGERLSGKAAVPQITVSSPVTINSAQTSVGDNPVGLASRLDVNSLNFDGLTNEEAIALFQRMSDEVLKRRGGKPVG